MFRDIGPFRTKPQNCSLFFFHLSPRAFFNTEEFAEVMRKTILHQRMPFNMDGEFTKLYFGKDKKRLINYGEFSQFLHVRMRLDVYIATPLSYH